MDFIFNVEDGLVCALHLSESPLEYWRTAFHSPIVKAWLYRSISHEIYPVSVLRRTFSAIHIFFSILCGLLTVLYRVLGDFMRAFKFIEGSLQENLRAGKDTRRVAVTTSLQVAIPPRQRESQLVYLGNHKGQLYIQSDGPIHLESLSNDQWFSVYNYANNNGLFVFKDSSYFRGFYWAGVASRPMRKPKPKLLEAVVSFGIGGYHGQCATDGSDVAGLNHDTYQNILINMAQSLAFDASSDQFDRISIRYHILTWTPQILAVLLLLMTLVESMWCSRRRRYENTCFGALRWLDLTTVSSLIETGEYCQRPLKTRS